MAIAISGKQINITTNEQSFPEFPDLLFGKSSEGIHYFDAQSYLQKHKPGSTVEDFLALYEAPIRSLMQSYEINEDDVCVFSSNRNIIIDSSLVYLFISFVEPNFLAYVCDRLHELFSSGVTVSDSYLLAQTRSRLTREVVESIINE